MSDYTYDAELIRVVDGDTVDLDVDLGFKVRVRERFRIYGINSPEKTGKTKAYGDAATAYLQELFDDSHYVYEIKTRVDNQEKFGSYLCEVIGQHVSGRTLNFGDEMVKAGHAVGYFGGRC